MKPDEIRKKTNKIDRVGFAPGKNGAGAAVKKIQGNPE
jgi:hypothetical protein